MGHKQIMVGAFLLLWCTLTASQAADMSGQDGDKGPAQDGAHARRTTKNMLHALEMASAQLQSVCCAVVSLQG
jgi:hypothetical protein